MSNIELWLFIKVPVWPNVEFSSRQMVPLCVFASTLFLQLTLGFEGKTQASDTRQMKLHCHNICLDTQSFLKSLWRERSEVSSVWHIKDLWLFICCQIGRQGEKNQACPAVQHHTTKGKSTLLVIPQPGHAQVFPIYGRSTAIQPQPESIFGAQWWGRCVWAQKKWQLKLV